MYIVCILYFYVYIYFLNLSLVASVFSRQYDLKKNARALFILLLSLAVIQGEQKLIRR